MAGRPKVVIQVTRPAGRNGLRPPSRPRMKVLANAVEVVARLVKGQLAQTVEGPVGDLLVRRAVPSWSRRRLLLVPDRKDVLALARRAVGDGRDVKGRPSPYLFEPAFERKLLSKRKKNVKKFKLKAV